MTLYFNYASIVWRVYFDDTNLHSSCINKATKVKCVHFSNLLVFLWCHRICHEKPVWNRKRHKYVGIQNKSPTEQKPVIIQNKSSKVGIQLKINKIKSVPGNLPYSKTRRKSKETGILIKSEDMTRLKVCQSNES